MKLRNLIKSLFKKKVKYEKPEIKELDTKIDWPWDVVYFEVNNWFSGRDYPCTPTFCKWMREEINPHHLSDDSWCKENKICVYIQYVDMSINYTVSAKKEWVLENCPELFTIDNQKFLRWPEHELELPEARFGIFREYSEENYGCEADPTFDYWALDCDDEDDLEEDGNIRD